jgi:acetyl esterase/lipase
MLGTSGGDVYLKGAEGAHLGTSSRVQATIDWFGPINFATMVSEGLALGFAANYSVDNESAYLGVDANDPANNALLQKANPSSYIDAQDPPFWVQVGGAYPLIPYTQSLNFYNALRAALGETKVGYEKLKGAGHGGAQFSTAARLDKAIAFLNTHLK